MRIKLLFIFFLFSNFIYGQKLEWVKSIYGSKDNSPLWINEIVKLDSKNNFLLLGQEVGPYDTDPSSNQNNISYLDTSVFFLTKWSENGEHLWTIYNYSFYYPSFTKLTIDKNDNIYFSNFISKNKLIKFQFKNQIFEKKTTIDGCVLYKLDKDGNFIWNIEIDSSTTVNIEDIKSNSKNEIIVSGVYRDSLTINIKNEGKKTYRCKFSSSNFILKLNENGEIIWFYPINLDFTEFSENTLDIDNNDNIYYTNLYNGISYLNPKDTNIQLNSQNWSKSYILKISDDGKYVFSKSLGFIGEINLKVDTFHNIYLYVRYGNTINYNPNDSNAVYNTGYNVNSALIKLDKNANYLWSKVFKNNFQMLGYNVNNLVLDDKATVIVRLQDSLILDSTGNHSYYWGSNTNMNLIVASYSLDGVLLNSFQIESYNNMFSNNIFSDNKKNLYVCVSHRNVVDFDPTLNVDNYGNKYFYERFYSIAKYSPFKYSQDSLSNGRRKVSIKHQEVLDDFMFNNPINNYLNITSKNFKSFQVSLFDLNGRKLLEKSVNKKATAQLDLREFASGIYILNCQSDERSQSYKIEKE